MLPSIPTRSRAAPLLALLMLLAGCTTGRPMVPDRSHFVTTQRLVIQQLIDDGLM